MKNFKEKVLNIVRDIPKGKVLTYKQVAELAGNQSAARPIGNILNKNYNPEIPCHRVVRSDYIVGGYNRGRVKKIKILRAEGIIIENNKVISPRT